MRVLLTAAVALMLAACGSTDSTSVPALPTALISVDSRLIDVGGRWALDASSSTDPRYTDQADKDLSYSWTMVHASSTSAFDDYCSDDDASDERCSSDDDCSVGSCGEGEGNTLVITSFSPDEEGPYKVRLTVSTGSASGTDVMTLDTYPSLFVAGTLARFGGTGGAAVGSLGSNSSFLSGAARGLVNPATRNLLVLVTDGSGAGVVREFNYQTGAIVGSFGETASFVSDPAAMAFDAADDLYLAASDGTVAVFDGATGIYLSTYGDDISGPSGESPVSVAFDSSGNLLAVYGAGVAGVYSYDGISSTAASVLGDTATALSAASDLDVVGSTGLLVVDPTAGALVGCGADGSSCSSFSALAAALTSGGDGPVSVAANPASDTATAAAVLILVDSAGGDYVIACDATGASCAAFGAASGLGTVAADIFFAPDSVPTTTTTTTTLPY